jgi:hypothetical protein
MDYSLIVGVRNGRYIVHSDEIEPHRVASGGGLAGMGGVASTRSSQSHALAAQAINQAPPLPTDPTPHGPPQESDLAAAAHASVVEAAAAAAAADAATGGRARVPSLSASPPPPTPSPDAAACSPPEPSSCLPVGVPHSGETRSASNSLSLTTTSISVPTATRPVRDWGSSSRPELSALLSAHVPSSSLSAPAAAACQGAFQSARALIRIGRHTHPLARAASVARRRRRCVRGHRFATRRGAVAALRRCASLARI